MTALSSELQIQRNYLFNGIASATVALSVTTLLWSQHTVTFIQNLQYTSWGAAGLVSVGVPLLCSLYDNATRLFLKETCKIKNTALVTLSGIIGGLTTGAGAALFFINYSIIPLEFSTGAPLVAIGAIVYLLFKLNSINRSSTRDHHDALAARLNLQLSSQKKSYEEQLEQKTSIEKTLKEKLAQTSQAYETLNLEKEALKKELGLKETSQMLYATRDEARIEQLKQELAELRKNRQADLIAQMDREKALRTELREEREKSFDKLKETAKKSLETMKQSYEEKLQAALAENAKILEEKNAIQSKLSGLLFSTQTY